MRTYFITFKGRLRGTKHGVIKVYHMRINAENPAKAILRLYETHDCIQELQTSLMPLSWEGVAVKYITTADYLKASARIVDEPKYVRSIPRLKDLQVAA